MIVILTRGVEELLEELETEIIRLVHLKEKILLLEQP